MFFFDFFAITVFQNPRFSRIRKTKLVPRHSCCNKSICYYLHIAEGYKTQLVLKSIEAATHFSPENMLQFFYLGLSRKLFTLI